MKQAFEKIIERLEDAKGIAFLTLANTGDKTRDIVYDEVMVYFETAIEIVNQVAEEYVPDKNAGEIDEVCEWKREVYYDKCPHEEGLFKRVHYDEAVERAFKYCPYCGKKIKVVE